MDVSPITVVTAAPAMVLVVFPVSRLTNLLSASVAPITAAIDGVSSQIDLLETQAPLTVTSANNHASFLTNNNLILRKVLSPLCPVGGMGLPGTVEWTGYLPLKPQTLYAVGFYVANDSGVTTTLNTTTIYEVEVD